MGRTVSVPREACEEGTVLYLDGSDYYSDELEWDDLIEDLRYNVFGQFPSVSEARGWLSNEDCILAENSLVSFGISEYSGLIAVWAVPRDVSGYYEDSYTLPLARNWLSQVWPKVEAMFPSRLAYDGSFSNGEAVYRRVES